MSGAGACWPHRWRMERHNRSIASAASRGSSCSHTCNTDQPKGVLLSIAFDVALKLAPPPVTIVLWGNAVVRTRVPEAPVNEYRYPCGGEGNIWSARKSWMIDTESEAATMQFSANKHLWARRGTRHSLHLSGDRGI